jgi:hypothetical protein
MKKKLYGILALILLASSCDVYEINTNSDEVFIKYYNSNDRSFGEGISRTPTGFFISGYNNTNTRGSEILVLTSDEFGNQRTPVRTHGEIGDDVLHKLVSTAGGDILMCGYTQSNSNSTKRAVVVKYNADGERLWLSDINDKLYDSEFYDVLEHNNAIYAVGYIAEDDGNNNMFYAAFNESNGSLIWEEEAHITGNEIATSLTVDANGGFNVIGEAFNNFTFQSIDTDLFYFKFNANGGSPINSFKFNVNGNDGAQHISAYNGNLVVLGTRTTNDGLIPSLSIYNSFLNLLWQQDFANTPQSAIKDFKLTGSSYIMLTSNEDENNASFSVYEGELNNENYSVKTFMGVNEITANSVLKQNNAYYIVGSNLQSDNTSSMVLLKLNSDFALD